MWYPKPRRCKGVLQLRRTALYCWATVQAKRTRTLQTNGRRMLRLTQRRHDCSPSFRHNNHTRWLGTVSAVNRIHRQLQLLEPLLALDHNHLRHPHPRRRNIRTTKTHLNTPLLKARQARLAGSSVVPFGKPNS